MPRKSGQRLGRASSQWAGLSLSVVVAFVLAGCAGYQLGPTNGLAPREKSVQITPFVNQTLHPGLTDVVTSQLRKELQRDGTYMLDTRGNADVLVSGTILKYDRIEVTLSSSDILTVQDYRLVLTARVKALERATGKVLFDEEVKGNTLIRVGSNLPSVEYQSMPLLANDLARNVTAMLADGRW
jgi:hypothetical protein